MLRIAELLGDTQTSLWKLVKQAGVNHVVGRLPTVCWGSEKPWDYVPLLRMKEGFERHGLTLSGIEERPPMAKIKRGDTGRDEEIRDVCTLIRNMGQLGIPVWCCEFMASVFVVRTSVATVGRGGALVSSYDHALMQRAPAAEPPGAVTEARLWDNLKYFMDRVLPVAEASAVKIAMHPDDPPVRSVHGVERIMVSLENFQKLLDLYPSPCNTIGLCQGNFTLMTDDLPAAIRHFGKQGRISFVHFRDVRGTAEKFEETFHDEGKTDLLACLRAYRDIGFDGVARPDHIPTMEGDGNEEPATSSVGRLFAIGYIRGLIEAVYGKEAR
jgi:mannonate dehydratase